MYVVRGFVVRGFVNGLFGEYGHQEYMISPKHGHFFAAIIDKKYSLLLLPIGRREH